MDESKRDGVRRSESSALGGGRGSLTEAQTTTTASTDGAAAAVGRERSGSTAATSSASSSREEGSQSHYGTPTALGRKEPLRRTGKEAGAGCCSGAVEAQMLRHRLEFERASRAATEIRERRLFAKYKEQLADNVDWPAQTDEMYRREWVLDFEIRAGMDLDELSELRSDRVQFLKWLSDFRREGIQLREAIVAKDYRIKEMELRLSKFPPAPCPSCRRNPSLPCH